MDPASKRPGSLTPLLVGLVLPVLAAGLALVFVPMVERPRVAEVGVQETQRGIRTEGSIRGLGRSRARKAVKERNELSILDVHFPDHGMFRVSAKMLRKLDPSPGDCPKRDLALHRRFPQGMLESRSDRYLSDFVAPLHEGQESPKSL
jgi:hypothetical protein